MRTPLRLTVALAVVLLTASGCGEAGDDTGSSATAGASTPAGPAPSPSDTASPTPSTGGTLPADLRTRPAVAAAIADTADREGVDPSKVVIAAWTPVTWTDGSLGCPQKGMSYTQALVEGELLMLRVDTGLFQYHAPAGGAFAYCASPSAAYSVSS